MRVRDREKTLNRRIRGSQKMFDAVVEEEDSHALSQPLVLRWSNVYWVEKAIVAGQRIVIYGKPKRTASSVVMAHPEFEIAEEDSEEPIHLQRITPSTGPRKGFRRAFCGGSSGMCW